jgi:ribonuclease P protein component
MLPLKNRLKKKKDFETVFGKGSIIKNKYFFLKIFKREENSDTRIGFIVSKKVSKKAVERNRIKRLFREVIRLNLGKIKPRYDMVYIVLASARDKDLSELEKEIMSILEKNKLIN